MGKHEPNLAVTKTKAVLTGYTGLFQEVIIMKTINVSNSLVAREIACAIEVYRHFSIVDGYPDNLTALAYTYETAKKIDKENYWEDCKQSFSIPLPLDKENAEILCRALQMYRVSEQVFWHHRKEIADGLQICTNQLCEDILAQYE